jgi:hypothetical protein
MVSQVVEPADAGPHASFFRFGRSGQATALNWPPRSTFAGIRVNGDLDCIVTRFGECEVK